MHLAYLETAGWENYSGRSQRIRFFRDAIGVVRLAEDRKITFPAFDYYWAKYLWTRTPYESEVQLIFERLSAVNNKVFVDGGARAGTHKGDSHHCSDVIQALQ
jgi:hypothetical protein